MPSEMKGRREIKYFPRTKQAWQWAAAFAITNCRWKSRRLEQLQKETFCRGLHIAEMAESPRKSNPNYWSIAHCLVGALEEAKARGVNPERKSAVKPLRWIRDKTDTLPPANS